MSGRNLSEKERFDRAIQLTALLDEWAKIELRKRDFARTIRDELTDVKSQIQRLKREVYTGEEESPAQPKLKGA